MPKPRGNNNKWFSQDMKSKRVSFKQQRGGRGADSSRLNIVRNFDNYDHLNLESLSLARGGHFSNRKFNRGTGRNRAGSPIPQKKLYNSPLNWYRVHMPYGGKYDKPFLLNKLLENINPLPLIPYMWTVEGRSAHFYVEDFAVASKLNTLNKGIEMPDGFKLVIRVHPDAPSIDLNDTLREKMKIVMSKRFNPVTKALDLSKFHADPDLQDTFCPLFKPVISLAAVNIIAENIPELEALNLNDNNIQVVSHLKDLPKKMPNLKTLYFARNKLKSINHLDSFSGLPLIELVLDGNQLCDNYKDQASYISEIRKRFPKLLVLDEVDLPAPISFDVEDVKMPPHKSTFLCSEDGQDMVRQFLAQYFEILDSYNRQTLLHAYHETALMSCTMSYGYNQHPKNSANLNWYSVDNRNLERLTDPERRRKLIKQGHHAIVAFHQEMPQTVHDLNSFTVDLTLYTPQMIMLNVTGLFKETRTGKKSSPIRHFFRTFAIIPSGAGFCIVNEMLHVTNATEEQMNRAFKTPAPTAASTSTPTAAIPAPAPASVPVAVAAAAPGSADSSFSDVSKHQMIEALAQASGMNIVWSEKCLQETNWDYQRALFAFTEANKIGQIPADAFIK